MGDLYEIRAAVDSQVVEALTQLLQEAKAGRITGLAYACLERGDDFSADVVGRARRTPILAYAITHILEQAVDRLFR